MWQAASHAKYAPAALAAPPTLMRLPPPSPAQAGPGQAGPEGWSDFNASSREWAQAWQGLGVQPLTTERPLSPGLLRLGSVSMRLGLLRPSTAAGEPTATGSATGGSWSGSRTASLAPTPSSGSAAHMPMAHFDTAAQAAAVSDPAAAAAGAAAAQPARHGDACSPRASTVASPPTETSAGGSRRGGLEGGREGPLRQGSLAATDYSLQVHPGSIVGAAGSEEGEAHASTEASSSKGGGAAAARRGRGRRLLRDWPRCCRA